jgi:hypothetical protein
MTASFKVSDQETNHKPNELINVESAKTSPPFVDRKKDTKPERTKSKSGPSFIFDFNDMRQQYPPALKWRVMYRQNKWWGKVPICAAVLTNERTGCMATYVQGGAQCKQAAQAARQAAAFAVVSTLEAFHAYLVVFTRQVVSSASLKLHLQMLKAQRR